MELRPGQAERCIHPRFELLWPERIEMVTKFGCPSSSMGWPSSRESFWSVSSQWRRGEAGSGLNVQLLQCPAHAGHVR